MFSTWRPRATSNSISPRLSSPNSKRCSNVRSSATLGAEVVTNLLTMIRRISICVEPSRCLSLSPDENGNRFFECADAARAHYLVTGNRKHFPAGLEDTEIVNARELIEIVTNQLRDE